MPKSLYRKELVSNPVLIDGVRVPFQPLAGNRGVLAIDDSKPEDAKLIAALDDLAARRKYGVVKITNEEYEGLKKKVLPSPQASGRRKLEKLKVMPSILKPKQPSPVKIVPAANPDEVKALEQYRKDFSRGVQEAKNGQQKQQSDNPAYNAGFASVSAPVGVVPSGEPQKPAPAFVPRTAPKPDAPVTESKPPATK